MKILKNAVAELFEELRRAHPWTLQSHLLENLVTPEQNQRLNIIFKALRGNIYNKITPIAWGGKIDENSWNAFTQSILSAIQKEPKYREVQKDLEKLMQQYFGLVKKQIVNTCAIKISVERLPFPDLFIVLQPHIIYPPRNPDKMQLVFEGYTVAADLQGIVPKNVLYTRGSNFPTFFSPVNGKFELPSYPNSEKEEILSNNFEFHHQFFDSIDHPILINHSITYHEKSHDQGQPFCDYLNHDDQLVENFKLIKSPVEIGHAKQGNYVLGLIQRMKQHSTLIIVDDDYLSYEGILKSVAILCHLGAACYEFGGTRIIKKVSQAALQTISFNPGQGSIPDDLAYLDEIPKGAKLEQWTQKDLDKLARQRGIVNLPVWTEEELENLAIRRGIIELPKWTEEDLDRLVKERGVPPSEAAEYVPDLDLGICPKCDYALQSEWDKCPICNSPNPNFKSNLKKMDVEKVKAEDIWHPEEAEKKSK